MIIVESKRKKEVTLLKKYPGAILADVTSRAETSLRLLSPFYPHGSIPVPGMPNEVATCVEAVWQGLKVFEREGIDTSLFANDTGRNLKRTVRRFGTPLGHSLGGRLLGYLEARETIYIPTYRWMLEHYCMHIIERLRQAHQAGATILLLDYDTNDDPSNPKKPLSHAALVRAYALGLPPYADALGLHQAQETPLKPEQRRQRDLFDEPLDY